MNISAEMAVSSAVNGQQSQVQQQAQLMMLKKSIDMQSQGAMALIESLPSVQSTQGLPANLGNTINTTA